MWLVPQVSVDHCPPASFANHDVLVKDVSAWSRISKNFIDGLFDSLSLKRQVELALKLVELGVKGDNEVSRPDFLQRVTILINTIASGEGDSAWMPENTSLD